MIECELTDDTCFWYLHTFSDSFRHIVCWFLPRRLKLIVDPLDRVRWLCLLWDHLNVIIRVIFFKGHFSHLFSPKTKLHLHGMTDADFTNESCL